MKGGIFMSIIYNPKNPLDPNERINKLVAKAFAKFIEFIFKKK